MSQKTNRTATGDMAMRPARSRAARHALDPKTNRFADRKDDTRHARVLIDLREDVHAAGLGEQIAQP